MVMGDDGGDELSGRENRSGLNKTSFLTEYGLEKGDQ